MRVSLYWSFRIALVTLVRDWRGPNRYGRLRHQANDRIITAVAKKLEIPKEKIFINIDKYGNMSAASISVALYEAVKSGSIKKGQTVVLVTFGAGLVAGANVVKF